MDLRELRSQGRKHVEEAIQSLPLEEKAVYLEAVEKAPYLFESESDPMKFLRVCDYNPWDAAKRLCLYWKERLADFGPERAFLPLVLTGEGAMDKQDILALKGGFPAILPETEDGVKVAFCDRRQWVPGTTNENRIRGFFYLANVLSEDERTQTEGMIVLTMLVAPRIWDFNPSFVKRTTYLSLHVFPCKLKRIHYLNCVPKQISSRGMKKHYQVQDLISSYMGNLVNVGDFSEDFAFHFNRSEGELLRLLKDEIRLAPTAIPRDLGGTWTFTDAITWCDQRISLERQTHKLLLRAIRQNQKGPTHESAKNEEEEIKMKKRALNAVNSRRKRERRRNAFKSLQEEFNTLVKDNHDLLAEQERLNRLLLQAQACVNKIRFT